MVGCKRVLLAATLLASLTSVSAAQQQRPTNSGGNWWTRIWLDYRRNAAWPDPFIPADRAAVKTPFMIMADKGWERQNLLAEYHFTDGNDELSPAGFRRLNWIATQAPLTRRVVFVQRGATPEITAARADAVQQALARFTPNGPLPKVVTSSLDSEGYPGEEADAVLNGSVKTRPDPRIPDAKPQAISN